MQSSFFSSSLFWLSGFSFPTVVFFLENYYFGKGWGLSHGRALTHVFCNLKPESEANSNTAVPGDGLALEMLSTHKPCTYLQSYFLLLLFLWKVLGAGEHVDRKQQGESLSCLSQDFFILFNLWMIWYWSRKKKCSQNMLQLIFSCCPCSPIRP